MVCVNSVTVNPKQKTMNVGEWCYDLSVSVTPTNATCQCVTWHSSNTEVATVNPTSGYVYAKKKGTVNIYATATDGSGASDYCTVTVEERILVQSLTMQPIEVTMPVGATDTLEAHLWPENATDKRVCWESCNPCIASVDDNGVVTANSVGETQVYAMTMDGSECCDYCTIIVFPVVEVETITVSPAETTLSIGEQLQLIATVSPANATNLTVRWSSSAPGVATVDENTGLVVAQRAGSANIYATAKDGSEKAGYCRVTVDSRERVVIKKDSHSFYVEFADGKIWKNIGLDLSNRQENYNQMYQTPMSYENYDDLIEEEQRYFDNVYVEERGEIVNNSYSEQQLGFLYLLDPFGIEYYMRNHACEHMDLGEMLFFKDRVYKEIFGVYPRLIKVFPDKTISYYVYSDTISASTRADYYTDAEILFGEHPIYDLMSFISFLLDVVPGVSLSLFSIFYPPAGVVLGGIEIIKFLFFSASATGVLSSGTSSVMEEYTSNIYTLAEGESAGIKAGKAMGWVNFLFGTITSILDAAAVFTPSINDITTYNRVNECNYLVKYNVNGLELSMADVIARVPVQ